MDFVFEQIRTGGDRNFAYLVGDRRAGVAAAVDPSYDPGAVHARAKAQGLEITTILNTHGHDDHVNGNAALAAATGARVGAHASSSIRPAIPLEDGDTVEIGSLRIEVLHVPGHTTDHVLFHLPAWKVALTGDHLFVGKIGGTGTRAEAEAEYASLERTLEALEDDTTIWPGHDYGCRPSSTLALEKATNPFLRVSDRDGFHALKDTWAGFKVQHGLV